MTLAEPKPAAAPVQPLAAGERPGRIFGALVFGFARIEDAAICLVFAAMMLLPVLEIALRLLGRHLPGAPELVQHSCLIAGMLGGALAARENKLLNISALPLFLKGSGKLLATAFANSTAAIVACILSWQALRFCLAERQAGQTLGNGLPVWILQLFMPIGFAIIAARLLFGGPSGWKQSRISILAALAFVALLQAAFIPETLRFWGAVAILAAATILGAPIFSALAGCAMLIYWAQDGALASLPIDHYRLVVNATIPAIPLFTLAGCIMAEGGAAARLLRLCQAAAGHFRGGPAIVAVVVSALFTAFTGASGVTILALGGLLLPMLVQSGFPSRAALGMVTCAGSLGLLLPPCLPLLLFAVVASNSGAFIDIRHMFVAGILPSLLLMAGTAAYGVRLSGAAPRDKFSAAELGRAAWVAKWELLIPVVALGAIFTGLATPVESAALTAFYTLIVELFLFRELRCRQLPRAVAECGLLVGGVLLILGIALGLTNGLIEAQVPDALLRWAGSWIGSRWMFLLVLNLFLLFVGCLMDVFSAIIVTVPLIIPLATAYGIHPLHLGMIFLTNLEIGFLTPPVGMNLFLSSYRFDKPVTEVSRAVLPLLAVNLIALLVITYVPQLSLWLPSLLAK